MPNCRSIEGRPSVVDERKRIGDWEADTIIGQNHQQAILSLVERKSKLCLLKKVERNTAEAVERAINELLCPLAEKVKTITTEQDIQRVTLRLNNRPRKRLNYRTPQRVFFKEQKIALTT